MNIIILYAYFCINCLNEMLIDLVISYKASIFTKRHFKRCISWPLLDTLLEKPQFPSASATPVPWPSENSYIHGIFMYKYL